MQLMMERGRGGRGGQRLRGRFSRCGLADGAGGRGRGEGREGPVSTYVAAARGRRCHHQPPRPTRGVAGRDARPAGAAAGQLRRRSERRFFFGRGPGGGVHCDAGTGGAGGHGRARCRREREQRRRPRRRGHEDGKWAGCQGQRLLKGGGVLMKGACGCFMPSMAVGQSEPQGAEPGEARGLTSTTRHAGPGPGRFSQPL